MKAVAALVLGLSLFAGVAGADPRRDDRDRDHDRRESVLDHRYNHDHYYPARGYAVNRLPVGYYTARYRRTIFTVECGTARTVRVSWSSRRLSA